MTYGEVWTGNAATTNTPVLWINKYLQTQISGIFTSDNESVSQLPFFPSTPSTIDDLTDYFGRSTQQLAATWDRLIKMNKKGFPHIKCEQILYYFYATGEDPVRQLRRFAPEPPGQDARPPGRRLFGCGDVLRRQARCRIECSWRVSRI